MIHIRLRKYIVRMVAFKVELIAYNLNEDAYKHSSISSSTDECCQVLHSKKSKFDATVMTCLPNSYGYFKEVKSR